MITQWDNIEGLFPRRPDVANILVRGIASFESFIGDEKFQNLSQRLNFHSLTINEGTVNTRALHKLIEELNGLQESRFRIFAIGGGGIIDYSKHLVYHFTQNNIKSIDNFIAVPTTAGSGSERTAFAVLYDENGSKSSVQANYLLPDHVFYKKEVLFNAPKNVIMYSGLDCICQSIESMLSRGKNRESTFLAKGGLELGIMNLPKLLNGDNEASFGMLNASRMAGEAINISKTTAAHAYSYYLTYFHNITHGSAVAFILKALLNQLKEKDDIITPIFNKYGYNNFSDFLDNIGYLSPQIPELDIERFLASVNKERLANYPYNINTNRLISEMFRS